MKLKGREKHFLLNGLQKEKLLYILKESHAIIAGGALRAVFNDSPISDYDCYFTCKADMEKALRYIEQCSDVKCLVCTENASTFKRGDVVIQIIQKFIRPTVEDLLGEFDFTVCMAAYDVANDELYLGEEFLKHNSQKRLVYNPKTLYPISSLIRTQKYIHKYGYKISGTELMKMALCINKIKLDTFADLKEHLLGIDTSFLKELTDKLDSDEMKFKQYDFDEFMYLIEEFMETNYSHLFDLEEEF